MRKNSEIYARKERIKQNKNDQMKEERKRKKKAKENEKEEIITM